MKKIDVYGPMGLWVEYPLINPQFQLPKVPFFIFGIVHLPPQKTNISPENQWLENEMSV